MRSNFHSRDFIDRNLGNAIINHMLTASANFPLSGPRLPTHISPSLPPFLVSFKARPIRTFAGNRAAPNAKHVAMVAPESVDRECTLAFNLSLYDQDTIQTWRRSHLYCNPLAQSDQSQPIHCSQGPPSSSWWCNWKSVESYRWVLEINRAIGLMLYIFTLLQLSRPLSPLGFMIDSPILAFNDITDPIIKVIKAIGFSCIVIFLIMIGVVFLVLNRFVNNKENDPSENETEK